MRTDNRQAGERRGVRQFRTAGQPVATCVPSAERCRLRPVCRIALAAMLAMTLLTLSVQLAAAQSQPRRSPSDTVREFYKALREKRFRDAFAISIYRPAIDGLNEQEFAALRPLFAELTDEGFKALRPKYQPLSPEEYEDLRPDLERIAGVVPANVEITGEQLSADSATVFLKSSEPNAPPEPVTLILENGEWILGDRENQAVVRRSGRDFFFEARINAHHNDVQSMFQRIAIAQIAYSQQNNGKYADLATLIKSGLVPKDIEGTESTGYRFRVTVSKDGRSYAAGAEPARYGRTGRLSFYMDPSGIRSADLQGKPLNP